MQFFKEPTYRPDIVCLNSTDYFKPFLISLTSPGMSISEQDVTEIIWQILFKFNTVNENILLSRLSSLPDFHTLTCKHVLDDWRKEQKLKDAIVNFGIHLFREARSLGLIRYNMNDDYDFPYYLAKIVSGKIILKYLSENTTTRI